MHPLGSHPMKLDTCFGKEWPGESRPWKSTFDHDATARRHDWLEYPQVNSTDSDSRHTFLKLWIRHTIQSVHAIDIHTEHISFYSAPQDFFQLPSIVFFYIFYLFRCVGLPTHRASWLAQSCPNQPQIWHICISLSISLGYHPFYHLFLLSLCFIFTLLFIWIWRTESAFVFRRSNWIGVTHLSLWFSIQSGFISYFGVFPLLLSFTLRSSPPIQR